MSAITVILPVPSPHCPTVPTQEHTWVCSGRFAEWPVTDSPWQNSESLLPTVLSPIRCKWFSTGMEANMSKDYSWWILLPNQVSETYLTSDICSAVQMEYVFCIQQECSAPKNNFLQALHSWCNNILRSLVSLFQKTSKHQWYMKKGQNVQSIRILAFIWKLVS